MITRSVKVKPWLCSFGKGASLNQNDNCLALFSHCAPAQHFLGIPAVFQNIGCGSLLKYWAAGFLSKLMEKVSSQNYFKYKTLRLPRIELGGRQLFDSVSLGLLLKGQEAGSRSKLCKQ